MIQKDSTIMKTNTDIDIEHVKFSIMMSGLSNNARKMGQPFDAVFELTPQCNFQCRMCYVRLPKDDVPRYGRELSAAEWIHIAEQARDMGVLNLVLTGGEPLMRPDFAEIYEAIAQMGFLVTLQTNCSLMTDGVMALLDRFPPYLIKTTLYGASDGAYEKVCGVRGGLTRVLDGIKKIQKAGIPLTAVATATRDNWAEMEETYRLAAGLGLRLAHTNRLLPHTRKPSSGASEAMVRFSDLSEGEREAVLKKREERKAAWGDRPRPRFTSPLQRCKVYRTGFWVLWDGRLSLCAHLLEPSYSLREMDLKTAWDKLIRELARLYPEDACAACAMNDVCRQCPATIQAKEPFAYSPRCEEMTRQRRMLIDGGGTSLPCDE